MIDTSSQVDVIISHDDKIYTGSYEINDGNRSGTIEVFTKSLNLISIYKTSGTFDLKIYNQYIYACTSDSIIEFDLSLNEIKKINTDYLNTYVSIHENNIYVCTSQGSIDVYDLNFNFIYKLQISNDILWINTIYKSFLVCGGEDSILYFINLKTKKIQTSLNFDQGITSLFVKTNILLTGNYDGYIYEIEDLKIISKNYIGGGVWKIKEHKEKYYISYMY